MIYKSSYFTIEFGEKFKTVWLNFKLEHEFETIVK